MGTETARELELQDLLDRVVASGPNRDLYLERCLLDAFFGDDVRLWPQGINSLGYSMTDSVDGALWLLGAARPGWRWVLHAPRSGLKYGASVTDPSPGGIVSVGEHGASAAHALIVALLKAYLSQEKRNPGSVPPLPAARNEGSRVPVLRL